ncbi:MAG: hypothetical protein MJK14_23260 [Rivularia sp. ALOHA_DT_140]|nr:hypothetical protein [Rivularia sp. ALOHA_DT_140]
MNEIVLPKTNVPGKIKADEVATQNNNSVDTAKTDEVVEEIKTADSAKADNIETQKTDVTSSVKADKVVEKEIETVNKVKTDNVDTENSNSTNTVTADEVVDKKTKAADTVTTDKVIEKEIKTADKVVTDKISASKEQKNLSEAAKEIQELLAPLKANYPTNSDYQKQIFINKFREEIRRNSHVREVIIDGGNELIKILCQPLNIPIEMGQKWLETAKRNQ